jgi:hypothetical protein
MAFVGETGNGFDNDDSAFEFTLTGGFYYRSFRACQSRRISGKVSALFCGADILR